MFEFAGIVALIFVAAAIFAVLSIVGLALKLVFKIALLPFAILGWVLKGLVLLLVVAIGLVLAPVLVGILAVVMLLALPALLLAGLAGAGAALA